MQFTFRIWGKSPLFVSSGDGDLNKNTDFQTHGYPLELGKKIISLPSWQENIAFMVSFSFIVC